MNEKITSSVIFAIQQAATSLRSVTACLWRHNSSSLGYSFRHAAAAAAVTLFFVFFYFFFYFSSFNYFTIFLFFVFVLFLF